jgi:hypothetical protein
MSHGSISTLFSAATSRSRLAAIYQIARLVERTGPELAGISEAGPAAQPGVAGNKEVIARHVKHVEPDP